MDQDKFNISMRKFLKQVGVTSQQKLEELVRETDLSGRSKLTVRMVLTADGTDFSHIVEGQIELD